MKKRLAVISSGILAGLLALGTANALVETESNPGAVVTVPVTSDQTSYQVGDAGTVVLDVVDSTLGVISIQQSVGWQIEIETATGREIEVDFRNGDRRIQFNAELEDGEVRVRARERTTAQTPLSTGATTTSSTTTDSTATSVTPSTIAPSTSGSQTTYQADSAGTVTIARTGSTLMIISVEPVSGWSHEIEVASGREVELDFRRGTQRVQFDAELEDGSVRVRVRNRTDSSDDATSGNQSGDDTSSARSGSSDDDSSDDENSNSGSGGGDDSSDDDDGSSGSGSGDDDSSDD